MKLLSAILTFCVVARGTMILAAPAEARQAAPARGEVSTLPALMVPHASIVPTIDGDTADAVWSQAGVIRGLLPALGATSPDDLAIQPTVVRVLWDEQNLYVAFDCTDKDIFSTGKLQHDEDIYAEDVVEVFLDGKGDGRQYVEIEVGPTGVNLDMMHLLTADPELGPDGRLSSRVMKQDRWKFREWEMVGLKTAARKTDKGWSAELAIPAGPVMKRLATDRFLPGEIRAHFMRYEWIHEEARSERQLIQQNWSPVILGNPHNTPARMGRLLLKDAP